MFPMQNNPLMAMVQAMQRGGNPMQILGGMGGNPQIAQFMQMINGKSGPHWTKEQTTQAMQQRGIDLDPTRFYIAMNMIYSDYCGAAKAIGCSNMDFYVEMAKAFLEDGDAVPDKLAAYYEYIVKH